jgi:cob(I)alamin adenosyltransferase
VARTVARRAERKVAKLYHDGDVRNIHGLQYLNRLSDVLFIMARFRDAQALPEGDPAIDSSPM